MAIAKMTDHDLIDRKATAENAPDVARLNRLVLDSLAAGIVALDRNGQATAINQAWHRFAKDCADDSPHKLRVGSNYLAKCRSADQSDPAAPLIVAGFQAAVNGTQSEFSGEFLLPMGEREGRFMLRVSRLADDSGVVVLLQEISQTEVVANDAERRNREERFELAAKGARDGIWDWNVVTGEIYFSPRWKSMLGYQDEELSDNFSEFETRLHPEDRERVMAAVQDYLAGRIEVYEVEFRMRHKDGSYRWILTRGASICDSQGHPTRMAGSHTDISERKRLEGRFREVVEAAPCGMVLVNQGGQIVIVNAQIEYLFGYARADLVGQSIDKLVPERFRGAHPKSRADYSDQPQIRSMGVGRELFGLRKDGTEFPVEIGLNPIQTEAGNMTLSTVVDITERKRAVRAIQDSEERLRSVVNTAVDAIIVIDERGNVESANPAMERLFGYTIDEVIGRNVNLLMPSPYRENHDQYLSNFFTTGVKKVIGIGREVVAQRKDGSVFPIELSVSEVWLGGRRKFTGIVRDVTKRKHAELALLANEKNFRTFVDTTSAMMWMTDASGRATLFNQSWLAFCGRELEQELALNWNGEEIHPDDRDACYELYGRSFQDRTRFEHEYRLKGNDGQYRWLFEVGAPWFEAGNNYAGFIGTATDITERREAEQALIRANANLDEFAYVASHDLKGPLRGIAELVDWIQEDLGETPAEGVVRNLDRMRVRVKRLEKLIEDLLAFSRAGRGSVTLERVDVHALVNEIIEVQAINAGFSVGVTAQVAPFVTARTPLDTVLRNLIANAVKHHDRGSGRIDISVTESGNYYLFAVADDGPGIPTVSQERIFKLFQTLSKNTGGSGIGLAVAKRLVETFGGELWVISHQGERGTRFEFTWPRELGDRE